MWCFCVAFQQVSVTITQNGAAPDQIESKITKKVEDAVGQISGVKHVSSTITARVILLLASS